MSVPSEATVEQLAAVTAPYGKAPAIRGHRPFAAGLRKARDVHVPPSRTRSRSTPSIDRRARFERAVQRTAFGGTVWASDRRRAASTQISELGLRVDSDVRDEASIARPALRKRVWSCVPNRRSSSPAVPIRFKYRFGGVSRAAANTKAPASGDQTGVDSYAPAERRSGRSAARRVEEPDPRVRVEPIDRRLLPIEREGDVHISCRRSQRAGRCAVALKPRRLCDGPGASPVRQRTARRDGEGGARPQPVCIPSATRIGSPVTSRRFRSSRWAMRVRSRMKKRMSGELKPCTDSSSDRRLRSGESSEAT